ncbi:hypothetical protein C8R44DRAFT_891342 [Mycena epipterygia]|nr:hypothetical protein C8R44DRAFT_891342 [Mycena epipterygia]
MLFPASSVTASCNPSLHSPFFVLAKIHAAMPPRDKDTQTVNNYIYGGVEEALGAEEGYKVTGQRGGLYSPMKQQRIKIIETITCVPSWYDAANTPEKCMDGTRVKIVRDLIEWLKAPPDPFKRILMLSGSAGSGKSTVTKSVASELAEVNLVYSAASRDV